MRIKAHARRVIRRVLLLTARLVLRQSAWERVPMQVPATAFGPGSRRQFSHYLTGESQVDVSSIDDVAEWLLTCEYATDPELFAQRDVWQHPAAFEEIRRGDCEDFALWTWRKLNEMGLEAEFCVGRVLHDSGDRQHAWVLYRSHEAQFLFEPAARQKDRMIRRLAEVHDRYVPHFAVDRQLRTSAFAGYALDSRRRDAAAGRS